jgi:hypothetical protein
MVHQAQASTRRLGSSRRVIVSVREHSVMATDREEGYQRINLEESLATHVGIHRVGLDPTISHMTKWIGSTRQFFVLRTKQFSRVWWSGTYYSSTYQELL